MKTEKKRRPLSLAFRLTLLISITALSAFLIFGLFTIHSVKRHFEEMDLAELRQVSVNLQRILTQGGDPAALQEQVMRAAAGHSNLFIALQDRQRRLIYQTPHGPDLIALADGLSPVARLDIDSMATRYGAALFASEHAGHQLKSGPTTGYRVAVLSLPGADERYALTIALAIDFHLHYIQDLTQSLLLGALFPGLLIIAIVRIAVYQGHAPLRKASREIQTITSANLHLRLSPDDVPIELQQLVNSFNAMIERIEEVFKRQSHFSADIAHEMRTPITNLVTQTQIALGQTRTLQEYQEVLHSNLEEYERLAKMISDMLFLAQADNKLLIPELTCIDLDGEIRALFDYFEAWAEERGVELKIEGDAPPISGDRLMLRRVFNNLLSNAIRYTPAGYSVTVRLTDTANETIAAVENPGPAIAAEHLPRLFDRFYRADPSRQKKGDGSGIGLAIVKSIVETHGGSISVLSDASLTQFIIRLPKHRKTSDNTAARPNAPLQERAD